MAEKEGETGIISSIDEIVSRVLGYSSFSPMVDIYETENEVIVTADIPGMDAKDLTINLVGDNLIIKGERKREYEEGKEESGSFRRSERQFGEFSRSFTLPCDVREEEVDAAYRAGVLHVRLPKSEGCRRKPVTVTVH
jgi:HSP20 family protein